MSTRITSIFGWSGELPISDSAPVDKFARAQARVNGKLVYQGAPCIECGNTERYVSNCTCRQCQIRKSKEKQIPAKETPIKRARRLAIEAGAVFYQGKPCKLCGSTEKYVSTYSCRACRIARGNPITPEDLS